MRLWEYIVNTLVGLILGAMLVSAWLNDSWREHPGELLFGIAGTVLCLFPDEAASYSGNWGWTRRQWRVAPAGYLKLAAFAMVLTGAWHFFTGN